MVSTLHPSTLTVAEGSVRKTYYKRDFAFLSSHFYITRYGYLTRNTLRQEKTRKQLLVSGEMRKVENKIVLDGLSTNMRRIVIPFLFLYLPYTC